MSHFYDVPIQYQLTVTIIRQFVVICDVNEVNLKNYKNPIVKSAKYYYNQLVEKR